MGFQSGNLTATNVSQSNSGRMYQYKYDTDSLATILASAYFSTADTSTGITGNDMGLIDEDTIYIIASDGLAFVEINVTTAGVISVTKILASGGSVQELTVSAAVNPGIESVELNHATVAIAATIATSVAHPGLFVVKDTSASGTAAHTLTLTAGTFNGTNNVATLNAPKECLVVYFDSAGNGTVVENVGTVGLS